MNWNIRDQSGGWDSNPGIFALQANAVAAVPPPHTIYSNKVLFKFVYFLKKFIILPRFVFLFIVISIVDMMSQFPSRGGWLTFLKITKIFYFSRRQIYFFRRVFKRLFAYLRIRINFG